MKIKDAQVALVTGAASGIGRSLVIALAKLNCVVIATDIQEKALEDTVRMAQEEGCKYPVQSYICDISSIDNIQKLYHNVSKQYSCISLLVNCAGIGAAGLFMDTELATWDKLIDVNLKSTVHMCHTFVHDMIQAKQPAHIVNISSLAGYVPLKDTPIYTTTKFAVLGFSEALRQTLARYDIGVSAICPGIINTPIIRNTIYEGSMKADMKLQDNLVKLYKLRGYTPDQVANKIVKAVKRNIGVLPVSFESWLLYYMRRFFPRILGKMLQADVIDFLRR